MRLEKGSYDICVVVPSFAEGLGIVPTLRTLAYQVRRLSLGIRVAVIVVVNNDQNPPKDVLQLNKDTYDFLRTIHSAKKSHLSLTQNYVQKAGIQVSAINRFSSRNALRDCNVGRARKEGFFEALRACKNDGIIIGTDADTRLTCRYLKQVLKMRNEGDFVATGPVTIPDSQLRLEVEQITFIIQAYHHIFQFDSYGVWHSLSKKHIPHLPGSNMAFSRKAYKDTDGIDCLPGAEDVRLGMKMATSGHEIIFDNDLHVLTDSRSSFRAPRGHSFGQSQHQFREGSKNLAHPLLPSKQFIRATKWIAPVFQSLRNRNFCDKEVFYSSLEKVFLEIGIRVDRKRMKSWWKRFKLCREFPGSFFDPSISVEVMDVIREKHPDISPLDAFRNLSDGLDQLSDKSFLEDLVTHRGLEGLHYCFFLFHMSSLCARFYDTQKYYSDQRAELKGTSSFEALEMYSNSVQLLVNAILGREKETQMKFLLNVLKEGDVFNFYSQEVQKISTSNDKYSPGHHAAAYYLSDIFPNDDRGNILNAAPPISDTFNMLHRVEREMHALIGEYLNQIGA